MLNIDDIKQLIKDGKFAEAIAESDIILEKYPASGPILLQRAIAHQRAGTLQLGLEDAERAVIHLQGTRRADAQLRRAICLHNLGKTAEAKQVLLYAKDTTETSQLTFWTSKLKSAPDATKMPAEIPFSDAPKPVQADVPAPIRKNWYQSQSAVTLDVYLRNAPKDAKVTIKSQRVAIEYEDIKFSLDLLAEIVPEKSNYTIGTPKIEVVLHKKDQFQWPKLEHDATFVAEKLAAAPAAAASGPKLVPFYERNWEVEDDDDEEENNDPNAFFEKIYKNADPDTKRAMMKSFTESNGTSLSTNWSDVSKGKVEPVPPKDFDIKKA